MEEVNKVEWKRGQSGVEEGNKVEWKRFDWMPRKTTHGRTSAIATPSKDGVGGRSVLVSHINVVELAPMVERVGCGNCKKWQQTPKSESSQQGKQGPTFVRLGKEWITKAR